MTDLEIRVAKIETMLLGVNLENFDRRTNVIKNLEKKLEKLSKKPRMDYLKEEIGLHFNLLSQKNEENSMNILLEFENLKKKLIAIIYLYQKS